MPSSSRSVTSGTKETSEGGTVDDADRAERGRGAYLRSLAMIVTAMAVMYVLTYVNTFELAHVQFSETRLYMTMLMGASMAVVMLAFMWRMHERVLLNVVIVLTSIAVFAAATYLVRSQTTVQEPSYLRAMIPHHSIAILTSERSEIDDLRVCELAVAITDAQRREITEMKWLLADIAANGEAKTSEQAQERPVPTFEGHSLRSCRER